jgi:hypothetical protein
LRAFIELVPFFMTLVASHGCVTTRPGKYRTIA